MNAALRRISCPSCCILTAALVASLALVGCDDDDFTETYQNCRVADYGGGEQYKLCCTAVCEYHYHYDYWDDDEYEVECQENPTCSTATGSACPDWVIEDQGYPPCLY